jgi:CMP-N-acetylneuraminic acid synthetase
MTPADHPSIDPNLPALALIPARGGSKGVPGKNLRPVGGIPLLVRTIRAAHAARTIGSVWVSTDDLGIGTMAEQEAAGWIRRPANLAGDQASSESALVHGLQELASHGPLPEIFVFLQCTSPFTQGRQIDAVVTALQTSDANMAFSVVPWHGFLWQQGADGHGLGVNHDSMQPRQRRQDLKPTYLETGAIYAIRTRPFLVQQTRFVPPTRPVPIEALAPEIDSAADLTLCDHLAALLDAQSAVNAGQEMH